MRKELVISIIFLFIMCLGLSQAEAWNPNGTWVNMDAEGGGTQRLEISFPTIHGYGQCHPLPCDWGNAAYTSELIANHDQANSDKDEYMAVWLFSFVWTFLYISPHPENPDYMVVRHYDIFDIVGNPSPNFYLIEYLKKQ